MILLVIGFVLGAGVTPIADVAFPTESERPQTWHATSFIEDAGLQGSAVFVIDFEADGTVWVAASDGLRRYDGYRWDRFTSEDGLPSDYVRSVRVTRDGLLWVGTDRGAGIFDGKSFDSRGSEDHLAGPSVRRIVEDPDGTLWFACDQWPPSDVPAGLTRLRAGVWESWSAEDGLPSDYVSDIFRDSSGTHYVLTRKGLARFDEGGFARPIEQAGLEQCRDYIWSMVETPRGDLVVATEKWFCVRTEGRWRAVPHDGPRVILPYMTRARDGTILACASEARARFAEWSNDRFAPIWTSELDTRRGVHYTTEAPGGAVWIGGIGLLARWERSGAEWQSFEGLVTPVLRGPHGGVWFSGRNRVLRLDGDRWTRFPDAFGGVVVDSSDGVWMHTATGLTRWTPDDSTRFSSEETGVEKPSHMSVDGAGDLWVLGRGRDGRLCSSRFDGRTWAVQSLLDIGPTEVVRISVPDPVRGMWYVLEDSETEFSRLLYSDGVEVADVPLPMVARRYWAPRVYADQSRRLWLFGWMGLYWKDLTDDSSEWERVDGIPASRVSELVELRDDVWISYSGTAGGRGGIGRLHDGHWTHFLTAADHIISRAGEEMLFFTHPRGVSIVTPDSTTPRLVSLPEPEWIRTVVPGPDGDLWIGTDDRVFRYRSDGIPPRTVIEHGDADIRHGKDLVLQVRGVERFNPATRPRNFNVAVQLDDGPWGEFQPLSDGRITIGDLTTGAHVARVRVEDQGGDVDPTPAEWQFRLHPVPLQDRAWFRPLAFGVFLTVLVLAGISVASRRRELGQRRRKLELEHEVLGIREREQRRIGRDLHDGLGQRLTSISFQCEALRKALVRGGDVSSERVQEIGVAVRQAIAETKTLAQDLYPAEISRHDLAGALDNLVNSVSAGLAGTCSYDHRWSPVDLDQDASLNVYRLVQEALGNALRHAAASTVHVELRRDGGTWVIEVRDDGRGFDPGIETTGLGLQIMRYRADLIHGKLIVDSRPGGGTTVRCEVPVDSDSPD